MLVIDNASVDGSHTAAIAAHPWARLIENPENVYLSPAWNQGIRETDAPYLLLLNPDTEWWTGTLADYVAVARVAPARGDRRPDGPEPGRRVYPSGRPLPSVVDAVGHAFLEPFVPRQSIHAAATTWKDGTAPPSARSTGSPVSACCCPGRRSMRSACSTSRSSCSARSSTWRRGCAMPAGRCCSHRRSRSSTRSACRAAGPDACP